jgi:hypothetical protein
MDGCKWSNEWTAEYWTGLKFASLGSDLRDVSDLRDLPDVFLLELPIQSGELDEAKK